MSKDKYKGQARRLKLLAQVGLSGMPVSCRGRPPLSDYVIQDCLRRGLLFVERVSTPGLFYGGARSMTTKIYLSDKGIEELAKA